MLSNVDILGFWPILSSLCMWESSSGVSTNTNTPCIIYLLAPRTCKSWKLYIYLVPPSIKGSNLEDFTVKVGEDLVLTVNFVGAPPPAIVWSRSGSKLTQSHRVTIKQEYNLTEIQIKTVERSDAGTYELKLSNSSGNKKASYLVTVLGMICYWH